MTNITFANNTLLVVTGATGTSSPVSGTSEVWTAASWSSMPIANPGGSPPTAFHIADPLLPSELIAVTNSSTGAVTRGAEGTTPVAHATGATYYQVISAGDLGNLVQGTAASFDVAGAATTALTTAEAFTTASYAPLASPAFTGSPTAPTQTPGDSSTKIATDAFVATSFAPLASPALTGSPTAPTQTPGDSSTKLATDAFVATAITNADATLAPLASPALTGSPTAPTQTAGDSSTKIATDAFVATSFAPLASPALTGSPTAPTQTAGDNSTKIATDAFVATSFAPLASPALTGSPTAPTQTAGDNSTKIATTAYVTTAAATKAPLASPTFTGTPAAPTGTPGDTTTQIATDAFVAAAISAIPGTTPGAWTSVPLSSASPNFVMRTGGYSSRYRKNIEGDVEIVGEWTCTSCSGTQTLSTALPSGFRPTVDQDIPCGWSSSGSPTSSPTLFLSTTGILTFYNLPTGTTLVQFHGIFPLT